MRPRIRTNLGVSAAVGLCVALASYARGQDAPKSGTPQNPPLSKAASKGVPKPTPAIDLPDFARPSDATAPAPANLGPDAPSYGPKDEAEGQPPARPAAPITFPLKSRPKSEPPKAGTTPTPAPTPATLPAVPPGEDPGPPEAAPLDLEVEKVQSLGTPPAARAAANDFGPALPPASDLPGKAATPAATATAGREAEPSFVLPPEKLPLGKQGLGLGVDVVSPQFLNLNQAADFKVVVRNSGTADAVGVVVRDELPDGLTFVSSQPDARRIDSLLSWNLGTVPAGTERTISLKVKPTKVGAYDHAATVTMMAGARSRTLVREPKLKVEQTAGTAKVLKGKSVPFKVTVSNPGDGPVRNVTVQAKLSGGLRYESGEVNDQNLLEQTIDLIPPGGNVVLDTLNVDAVQGGEQTCTVDVKSPDVQPGLPEARTTQTITVVEPKLEMKVDGPTKRVADMLASYEMTLTNPGTAPARDVRVVATVPLNGRLTAVPAGAQWDKQTRKLFWTRPTLDPGEKVVLSFQVRMGGIGLFQVAAEAKAEGPLLAKGTFSTDVTGLADVDVEVTEKRRVVDVNDQTVYSIKVTNHGTKEATRLQIKAELSKNIVAEETSGTETEAGTDKDKHTVIFPLIDRLGPGKSMELGIRVRVTGQDMKDNGIATASVTLKHDDMSEGENVLDVASFKILAGRRDAPAQR